MTDTISAPRKPRLGIMGEFSAGKSTLSNLLLGRRVLPEKVTATQLPPVWMSTGTEKPTRVTTDGQTLPILLDQLENISPEETLYIKINIEAEILNHCDLIDFPGISDPNMSSDVWERLLCEVDGVLWCTHATQAWRQSESAAWDLVPEHVRKKSLLLITRFDKLISTRDKERVKTRVSHEASDLFADICPISLTQSLAAGNHETLMQASGAQHLFMAIAKILEDTDSADVFAAPNSDDECAFDDHNETTDDAQNLQISDVPQICATDAAPKAQDGIIPRRVKTTGGQRTQRPGKSERSSVLNASS